MLQFRWEGDFTRVLGDAMRCPSAGGPTAPALLWTCLGNPACAGWFRPRSLSLAGHMHQACKSKALYLHGKGCPLRPWGEAWRLGHGAHCCCGGSLGVCVPVGMCLCMFAAARVCTCMCVCTHVYIWVVCLTHVCTCISLVCARV